MFGAGSSAPEEERKVTERLMRKRILISLERMTSATREEPDISSGTITTARASSEINTVTESQYNGGNTNVEKEITENVEVAKPSSICHLQAHVSRLATGAFGQVPSTNAEKEVEQDKQKDKYLEKEASEDL